MGKLYGVPELPPHYLPREIELAGLKEKLLAADRNVGITGQSSAVGVQGMGGIGKTVLAAALVRHSEVRQAFPEGIFWVMVGQTPSLLLLQGQLLEKLTGMAPAFSDPQQCKDALRDALEDRRTLVVLDDVWSVDHVDAFSVSAPSARLLITTRDNEILIGMDA